MGKPKKFNGVINLKPGRSKFGTLTVTKGADGRNVVQFEMDHAAFNAQMDKEEREGVEKAIKSYPVDKLDTRIKDLTRRVLNSTRGSREHTRLSGKLSVYEAERASR